MKLSIVISSASLIIALVALFLVSKIDFSGYAKDITAKIEENTKASKNILKRSSIGIEFTDPPLEKVNFWGDPKISNWFNNPKEADMDCCPLGNVGRLLGATIIVSNLPKEKATIEVYVTKRDYTEVQPGFYNPPETKDRIPNMIMKSFDIVICDNTTHQLIVVIRDSESDNILKYELFTIK